MARWVAEWVGRGWGVRAGALVSGRIHSSREARRCRAPQDASEACFCSNARHGFWHGWVEECAHLLSKRGVGRCEGAHDRVPPCKEPRAALQPHRHGALPATRASASFFVDGLSSSIGSGKEKGARFRCKQENCASFGQERI